MTFRNIWGLTLMMAPCQQSCSALRIFTPTLVFVKEEQTYELYKSTNKIWETKFFGGIFLQEQMFLVSQNQDSCTWDWDVTAFVTNIVKFVFDVRISCRLFMWWGCYKFTRWCWLSFRFIQLFPFMRRGQLSVCYRRTDVKRTSPINSSLQFWIGYQQTR